MFYQFLRLFSGLILMCLGAVLYARQGNAVSLLLLVIGAISVTTSTVVIGVRQMLKEERKQREIAARPVLNI
jgi:hypothetical protein